MLLARVEGQLLQASVEGERRGVCPTCGSVVIAKTGSFVSWHWAHTANASCDPWVDNETEWHYDWKRLALACGARVEVPIRDARTGVIHRADIVLPDDVVVEVQHSGLKPEELAAREIFYAAHGGLRWIFDAPSLGWWIDPRRRDEASSSGWEPSPDLRRHFGGSMDNVFGVFKYPPPMLAEVRAPMAWDLSAGDYTHVGPPLGWVSGPAWVGQLREFLVKVDDAVAADVLAPGGPALRPMQSVADRTETRRLFTWVPPQPGAITPRTLDGALRRANDHAVLFAIMCPRCGAPASRPCFGLARCGARRQKAAELLAEAQQ